MRAFTSTCSPRMKEMERRVRRVRSANEEVGSREWYRKIHEISVITVEPFLKDTPEIRTHLY